MDRMPDKPHKEMYIDPQDLISRQGDGIKELTRGSLPSTMPNAQADHWLVINASVATIGGARVTVVLCGPDSKGYYKGTRDLVDSTVKDPVLYSVSRQFLDGLLSEIPNSVHY